MDRFDRLPGIIDHGLFPPEMIDVVIVGHGHQVEWIRPRRRCG
jgi:ribose 5-phosphate isomerase